MTNPLIDQVLYDLILIGKLMWTLLAIILRADFLHQVMEIRNLFEKNDFKLGQFGQFLNNNIEIELKNVRLTELRDFRLNCLKKSVKDFQKAFIHYLNSKQESYKVEHLCALALLKNA